MPKRVRCPGHNRHWFTQYNAPTIRLPFCARCKAPNPYWTPAVEAKMRLMIGDAEVEEMLRS